MNNINKLNLIKKKREYSEDVIWYKDINIIFNKNRLDEFFPIPEMNLEEKMNAIVRLTLYLSIVLVLFTFEFSYMYIFVITLILSYIIHINYKKDINTETYVNNKLNYIEPTIDNPFMNIQYDDYIKNPNRESLNKINNYKNDLLNKKIEDMFDYNLYKDFSDIYNKNNSQRQFYTTPVTTIPNDQTSFANWLYKIDKTCKENNGKQCLANIPNNLKQSSLFR